MDTLYLYCVLTNSDRVIEIEENEDCREQYIQSNARVQFHGSIVRFVQ
jgi:hypothetical protein